MKPSTPSTTSQALVVRLDPKMLSRVDRAARARGLKRSEFVRQIIAASVESGGDLSAEARRQSQLVSRSKSEKEAAEFTAAAMSTEGWR